MEGLPAANGFINAPKRDFAALFKTHFPAGILEHYGLIWFGNPLSGY